MLTPEQMQALQDALEKITDPVTEFIVRDIIRRVSEAGKITRTAEYQIKQAIWLKKSKEGINTLIRKENPSEEIAKTFSKALDTIYDQMGAEPDTISNEILQAAINLAQEDFTNITQTLGMVDPFGNAQPLQKAYISCADYAFKKVLTGAQSYQEACYEATKNLIEKGVRVIDYESGVHTSVEAAVRRDIFGGMGLMVEQVENHVHEELAATGWELSAHEACAEDHEPYQGRQFTNEEYEELNGSAEHPGILKRRIGTLNCKHVAFPVMIGIQKPIYSEEQLKAMEERNHKGITFEGKHYTMYEATQMQRKLERAIRAQRRKITALEELPDQDDKLRNASVRYTQLTQKYKAFSKASGLKTQDARTLTVGYGPKQEKIVWNEAEDNYQEWSKSIGVNSSIPTLDEYYDIKYNNPPAYEILKRYIHSVDAGMFSPLVKFDLYKDYYEKIEERLVGVEVNGVTITGQTAHFLERVFGCRVDPKTGKPRYGVTLECIFDCINNPKKIKPIVTNENGDRSFVVVGEKAKVSINPDTGLLIQTNP